MMRFEDIPLLSGSGRLGHFEEMRRDRFGMLRRIAREGHDLVRVEIFPNRVCLANAPGPLYEVLFEKADRFRKSPVLRSVLYPLAGEGLFTSEGELWRRQRRLMAPIFRYKMLGHFAAQMSACGERAVASWRDGETIDVARETTRIAMGVAGRALFDAETFDEADEIGHALTVALAWANEKTSAPSVLLQARLKTALDVQTRAWPEPFDGWRKKLAARLDDPILLPTRRTREMRAAIRLLDERVERMIAERRRQPGRQDLLTLLLEAKDEDDHSGMSDKQVRDEVLTLFIAGHETTASGLAWALYLLGRDAEALRRARAEADALGGRLPGYADLPLLPYCLQVFKEALRLYPPIYVFGRQALTDVEVGGYRLPAGTIVIITPYALHRRADVWPDPERFDPTRFTPEAEESRPREAYLPFSGGPRTCIGNHFALMEGPLVLATILARAELELAPGTVVEPEPSATLRPKGGVPMRVRVRRPAVSEQPRASSS
jgi:cytochrome P450